MWTSSTCRPCTCITTWPDNRPGADGRFRCSLRPRASRSWAARTGRRSRGTECLRSAKCCNAWPSSGRKTAPWSNSRPGKSPKSCARAEARWARSPPRPAGSTPWTPACWNKPPRGWNEPGTRTGAVSVPGRSSLTRWSCVFCCGYGTAPASSGTGTWSRSRWTRWLAAASTTTWAAASIATAWTGAGWCRTSKKCSTTTPCSPPPTWKRTKPPAARSGPPLPGKHWTTCCATCACPRELSPRPRTPTARGAKGPTTSGRPNRSSNTSTRKMPGCSATCTM